MRAGLHARLNSKPKRKVLRSFWPKSDLLKTNRGKSNSRYPHGEKWHHWVLVFTEKWPRDILEDPSHQMAGMLWTRADRTESWMNNVRGLYIWINSGAQMTPFNDKTTCIQMTSAITAVTALTIWLHPQSNDLQFVIFSKGINKRGTIPR